MYPGYSVYECKYCKRKFEFSGGYNLPRLIEHLSKCHRQKIEEYRNLYVTDLAKACFEFKGGTHS